MKSHLESQSIMFGHFAVFLVGFGELTTLGGRGDGPEVKNQCWMEVSQLFLSETRDLSHRTPRTNQLCQSVLQASVACVACVSDRVFAPKFLFHSLLFLTNSLATQAKTRGHNTTYYDLLFQGIDPFSKRRLHSR